MEGFREAKSPTALRGKRRKHLIRLPVGQSPSPQGEGFDGAPTAMGSRPTEGGKQWRAHITADYLCLRRVTFRIDGKSPKGDRGLRPPGPQGDKKNASLLLEGAGKRRWSGGWLRNAACCGRKFLRHILRGATGAVPRSVYWHFEVIAVIREMGVANLLLGQTDVSDR